MLIIKQLGGGKLIVRSIMNQLWFNERFMFGNLSFEVFGRINLSWSVLLYRELLSIFTSAPV